MKKCEVISICTQKGGAAKTTTASNLAVGLVCKGKKVCCIDMDPQASLTMALVISCPSNVKTSIAGVLKAVLCGETVFNDVIIIKYKVTITETLSKTYEVEADTLANAEDIVADSFYDALDGYILGADVADAQKIDGRQRRRPPLFSSVPLRFSP